MQHTATRNKEIDMVKGIGILLVVLGHAISPVSSGNLLLSKFYTIIYSFHMPLFFFVSGFLSKKLLTADDKKGKIKSKFFRLMIPYCVWAIIYIPLKIIMERFSRFGFDVKALWTIVLGNNPNGQLWFLYVMFVLAVITILFVNKKNLCIAIVIAAVISFFSPLYTPALPGISLSFSALMAVFYIGGLAFSADALEIIKKPAVALLSGILFILYFVVKFCSAVNIWFLKLVPATCGIILVLYLCRLLSKTKVKNVLSYLGQKSMNIYILHAPILICVRILLLNILKLYNPYFFIVVAVSISLLGSFLISKFIVEKNKLLGAMLLGNKYEV